MPTDTRVHVSSDTKWGGLEARAAERQVLQERFYESKQGIRVTNQSFKVKLHPLLNFAFLRLCLEVKISENASSVLKKMCLNKRVSNAHIHCLDFYKIGKH